MKPDPAANHFSSRSNPSMESASTNPQKLVFVVGMWRSGTSLLHALLNNHPEIGLMYEAEPFGLFRKSTTAQFPVNWCHRLEFYNGCFSRHQLDLASIPANQSGVQSARILFQTWARKKNAHVYGQKCPAHHGNLPHIAHLFPDARFIIIWRNPLDCCRSAMNSGKTDLFFRKSGILLRTLLGFSKMAKGVTKIRSSGRHVHEVCYESLIRSPEDELKSICSFLQLEYDPNMTNLAAADLSMVPAGVHHSRVRSTSIKRQDRTNSADLPDSFAAKALRYCAMWMQQYAHLKFTESINPSSATSSPGRYEYFLDQLIYGFWRFTDQVKKLILRNVPIALWSLWRRRVNHAENFIRDSQ